VLGATIGRPEGLGRLLRRLAAQKLGADAFEVHVAVDGADPASETVLEEARALLPRLTWSRGDRCRGPAAARNRALAATRAPLVATTDDDCEPDPGWLGAFLRAFAARPEIGAFVGRTETDRDRLTPFSHYVENLAGEGHQTCNSAWRRPLLDELGGFDERFPAAYLEDTDLYCRAQRVTKIAFCPEARVFHPPREVGVLAFARGARKYESDFIFHAKDPALYRSRHAGRGPAAALLWDLGVKHSLKQLARHLPWLRRRPALYIRYLLALALFVLRLAAFVPGWRLRHRPPP
jgi:GT2 family glycosyltransferase